MHLNIIMLNKNSQIKKSICTVDDSISMNFYKILKKCKLIYSDSDCLRRQGGAQGAREWNYKGTWRDFWVNDCAHYLDYDVDSKEVCIYQNSSNCML